MRADAIAAIDAAKPYKGGNEPLWRIHELNNIDKHRSLFSVAHDYLFVADWLPWGQPYWHKVEDPNFPGVFGDDVEKDIQAEIDKTIDKTQILRSEALLPTLHKLVDFTSHFTQGFLSLLE
jgi:hypothetical protein